MAALKYKDDNNQWLAVVNYNVTTPTVVQTTGSSTQDVMSQKAVTDELDAKVDATDLATVATSGSYTDLSNKPVVPDELADLQDDSTHRLVTDTEKSTWNAKSDFSGSYDDLTNKPTIPTAQVNSDWNANTGVAQILNKPTLSTVATSGSYNDLSGKPVINNGTLTIKQNGTSKGTFTANQSDASTVELTDTTYSSKTASSGGVDVSLVTTGEKYTWNNKQDKKTTISGYGITDAYTKTEIDTLTRHTRKTDFDLTVLKLAVADQNLEKYGLKVGDQKTINGRTYVIAGLNPMKGTYTPYRLTQNHVGLIVIPHTTQAWNASGNTYTGADNRGAGYANSDLHHYLVNTLLPLVQNDLGAANLLKHSKLLTNAVNQTGYNRYGSATGCSSGWEWAADQYISALSEVQVYGSIVWSSSGFDTGEACRQLDVFQKYSHTEIFGNEYPWLRDVASATRAAYARNFGLAYYDNASFPIYVAALILFN